VAKVSRLREGDDLQRTMTDKPALHFGDYRSRHHHGHGLASWPSADLTRPGRIETNLCVDWTHARRFLFKSDGTWSYSGSNRTLVRRGSTLTNAPDCNCASSCFRLAALDYSVTPLGTMHDTWASTPLNSLCG